MNIVTTTSAVARTAAPLAAAAPVASDNAQALHQAATQLLPFLEQGKPITRGALRAAMTESFGGTDAQGLWIWKDAYEALEAVQVLFIRRFGPAILSRSASAQTGTRPRSSPAPRRSPKRAASLSQTGSKRSPRTESR